MLTGFRFHKYCSRCDKFKPFSYFTKDESRRSGLCSFCKSCAKKDRHARKKVISTCRDRHKSERRIWEKEYRKEHRKRLIEYSRKYYVTNKARLLIEQKEYSRIYIPNKLKTDISFRIAHYLRCRVYSALKGNCKSQSTLKLLGCSIKHLRAYLERQFKPRMTWKNYGKWHVDHMRPCASFDLSKPSEQKKCFNYRNLQPLWADENIKKGSKREV